MCRIFLLFIGIGVFYASAAGAETLESRIAAIVGDSDMGVAVISSMGRHSEYKWRQALRDAERDEVPSGAGYGQDNVG